MFLKTIPMHCSRLPKLSPKRFLLERGPGKGLLALASGGHWHSVFFLTRWKSWACPLGLGSQEAQLQLGSTAELHGLGEAPFPPLPDLVFVLLLLYCLYPV